MRGRGRAARGRGRGRGGRGRGGGGRRQKEGTRQTHAHDELLAKLVKKCNCMHTHTTHVHA